MGVSVGMGGEVGLLVADKGMADSISQADNSQALASRMVHNQIDDRLCIE
jgi:hypothetical protein